MNQTLYPLKFQPILKEKIWGGTKLVNDLNKLSKSSKLGESWEVSAVPGDISIISNGSLKGRNLQDVLETYQSDLLGTKNYERFGNEFPLLIKFIDAKQDLSIQLHPGDELAEKRHNSFGKTEMWYVMQSDEDANLIVGFNRDMDKDTYLHHLNNNSLPEILNFEKVKEGDTYFIEAGRVHAIGAGILLAEIQQTSDVTYRVYDWDRVDDDGRPRELHNDIAIDAIDFNLKNDFKISYDRTKNQSNEMVRCPYFRTNFIELNSKLDKINSHDSFLIYMCVEGNVSFETESMIETISKGETLLLPASIKAFTIHSDFGKLLEVYV